jgi:hypothetical protein
MNRLFPNKIPKGAHVHGVQIVIPDTIDEIEPSLEGFCHILHDSCRKHDVALASLMYGFVSPNGFVPYLCGLLSDKMNRPLSNMSVCVLCTMGAQLIKIEMLKVKEDLEAEGLETEDATIEWFKEHADRHSFTFICAAMDEEPSCDCPACLLFWAGRQSIVCRSKKEMHNAIDKLNAFIDTDPERHGPGCVKHLIPDSDVGEWQVNGNDGSFFVGGSS